MSELGVNSVGAQQNYPVSGAKPQNSTQTQQGNSIFGDFNNNGIVDKSDFKDASIAQMAEEKGLIGKAWDAVQDMLKNLTDSGQQEPLSKLSQDDRQSLIDAFKKNGVEFKEYPDGSIECIKDGTKTVYSWNGNVSRMTMSYSNGNTIISDYNLETNEGGDTITNADGTLKHEVKYDKDGNIVSTKNYEKNENGEIVESNKFVAADMSTGEIYSGSDLAKIFTDKNFEFSSDFENFIRKVLPDVAEINDMRNGPYGIIMKDGTQITYDYDYMNAVSGLEEPKLIISKDGMVQEIYNPKGESITE